jgi:exopolysaccharide biosynthesis protein
MVEELAGTRGVVRILARLGTWKTPPRAVVGGWGRLIQAGVNVGKAADSLEGTFPRFSAARHPRSAIAISRDSSTVMLAVVDGRRPWSVGMSFGELADALIALGAWEAMNLDGGGSSTLWIRGTVVNYPSDVAGERPVGNAMFVLRTR